MLNDTGDLYRFFDATPHAEFLYACVRQTIEVDLPREAAFLARYDDFRARIKALVEMPERTIDLLFRFLQQHEGRLSTRVREREFAGLTDREAAEVEAAYREVLRTEHGLKRRRIVSSCRVRRAAVHAPPSTS